MPNVYEKQRLSCGMARLDIYIDMSEDCLALCLLAGALSLHIHECYMIEQRSRICKAKAPVSNTHSQSCTYTRCVLLVSLVPTVES